MIASSKASSFVCRQCRAGLSRIGRSTPPSPFLRASRARIATPSSICRIREYSNATSDPSQPASQVNDDNGAKSQPTESTGEPLKAQDDPEDDVQWPEELPEAEPDKVSLWPDNKFYPGDNTPRPPADPNKLRPFRWRADKKRRVPEPATFFESRGKRVYMKPEDIEIDILGAPAKAIVMKDIGRIRKRRSPDFFNPVAEDVEAEEAAIEEDGTDAARVFDEMNLEMDDITTEDVQENIGELRPKESVLLNREFEELRQVLRKGFTGVQLALYLQLNAKRKQSSAVTVSESDAGDEVEAGTEDVDASRESGDESLDSAPPFSAERRNSPWLTKQLPWVPAISDQEVEVHPPHLRGYITRGLVQKERLAVRIMRECWGLSTREVLASRGHLDVSLGELECALLTLGDRRWIEPIVRNLQSGEGVDLFQSTRLMRINAPKATAETVLGDILAVLKNSFTKSFKITDLRPDGKAINPVLLQEVAALTNTHVHVDDSEIHVSWINIARNPYHEDAGDQAYRLLLSALQPTTTQSSLATAGEAPADEAGLLVEEHWAQEKWAWHHRLALWSRWTKPISTQAAQADRPRLSGLPDGITSDILKWDVKPLPESEGEAKAKPIAIPFNAARVPTVTKSEDKDSTDLPREWSADPIISTAATFGHILHPIGTSKSQFGRPTTLRPSAPPNPDTERILSPILPPILKSGLPTDLPKDSIRNTILIRLRAAPHRIPTSNLGPSTFSTQPHLNPSSSPSHISPSSIPHLELRLDATDALNTHLASVRAITGTSTTDLLFPHLRADARLTQTRYHTLPLALIDGASPISVFLRRSHLAINSGRLTTPARLSGLTLPTRLLTPDAQDESREEVPVEYIFAGLEMQRSIATSLNGWRMLYTWIEGGKGGGRRGELTLDANPASLVEGADQELADVPEISKEGFLKAVVNAVDGATLKWFHSPDSRKLDDSME